MHVAGWLGYITLLRGRDSQDNDSQLNLNKFNMIKVLIVHKTEHYHLSLPTLLKVLSR